MAVKNHKHGSLNPKAQFQKEIKLDTVLKSATVADPLSMFDCAPDLRRGGGGRAVRHGEGQEVHRHAGQDPGLGAGVRYAGAASPQRHHAGSTPPRWRPSGPSSRPG